MSKFIKIKIKKSKRFMYEYFRHSCLVEKDPTPLTVSCMLLVSGVCGTRTWGQPLDYSELLKMNVIHSNDISSSFTSIGIVAL